LIAYALENFLKALLIHQKQKTLGACLHQSLREYFKGHDPIELASKAKFNIDVSEEELFCRLSRYFIWKARYPIPLSSDALANVKILSDEKAHFTDYYKPQDIETIHSIINRLRKYVVTEIGINI